MHPPRFDYVAPTSVDEALDVLAEHGDDAKVLAGGQSLIPLMKLRFAAPALLVDLNRVAGLDHIADDGDVVRIGALARHAALERSPLLAEQLPALPATARLIADPLVRNLGTVGGSLCHADPAGDVASTMLALGAELVLRRRDGERVVPIDEFLQGTFETVTAPDELLVDVRVPKPRAAAAGTYLKLERKVGDFATVGVAVQVELDGGDGRIARAGIALTAVGPRNVRVTAAEEALAGANADAGAFAEGARLAADAAEPRSDERGSAAYKRAVVRTYVERGLVRSTELARA